MGRTACSKLLYPTEVSPIIKPLVDLEPSFDYYVIPSFADMVNSTPEKYIYHKKFDEAINDPLLVLHSSGSTGNTHNLFERMLDLPRIRTTQAYHNDKWLICCA